MAIDEPTIEDAFTSIVRFLQNPPPKQIRYGSQYGYGLYLPQVMFEYLRNQGAEVDSDTVLVRFRSLSPAFFAAAWDLCRRGILRPGVATYNEQSTSEGSSGSGYSLTPFGDAWLREAAGRYDYVPTEPGRFAQTLDAFAPHFGQGFKERAQEAIRCYGAHAFLACCAMCGAAAESILLAVAIAKSGDREKIEKMYLGGGGRGRVEKYLVGGQAPQLADEFKGYVSLLKYWRDNAAHGMASGIQDNEAFTALAFLLRFAQFASGRWDDLTK